MVPSPSPPLETSDNDTEVFESDQELLLDIDDDFSDDDEKQSSPRQVLWNTDSEPSEKGSQHIYVGEAALTSPPINKRAHKEIRLKDLNSHDYEFSNKPIRKNGEPILTMVLLQLFRHRKHRKLDNTVRIGSCKVGCYMLQSPLTI